MWHQTTPLFQKTYIRATLLIFIIQFCLFATTNGVYLWFPHIINSMVEFMHDHPGDSKKMCDIVYAKQEALYKNDGVNTKIKFNHPIIE